MNNIFAKACKFEEAYKSNLKMNHRKEFGQFFTPEKITNIMNLWITTDSNCRKILDPALGLGAFYKDLYSNFQYWNYHLYGYEIDKEILKYAKNIFGEKIRYFEEDFLASASEEKYNGIICNPPYLKFQDYEAKDIILELFKNKYKFNLSGLSNIYSLFILKAINLLEEKGRAAFIIPSEFMNSDYGVSIKRHILKSKMLKYIIVFDTNLRIFEDALTTSCILLFAKDTNLSNIEFIKIGKLEELQQLKEHIVGYNKLPSTSNASELFIKNNIKSFHSDELDPNCKWRIYYDIQNTIKYKNIVPFRRYARASRGIATGSNDYFMFNRSKVEEYGIDIKYFVPCISKAQYVERAFFTPGDLDLLKEKNKNMYLLYILKGMVPNLDKNVLSYLKLGEKLGVNKTYLNSNRKPWYLMEKNSIADIWVGVFNRAGVKFILNEAKAYNLTTFHGIYVNKDISKNRIDILLAYFLTRVSKEIFDDSKRVYGGGLNKFEPNDINNSYVIDLDILDERDELEILALYKKIISKQREKTEYEPLLEELNSIFKGLLNKG